MPRSKKGFQKGHPTFVSVETYIKISKQFRGKGNPFYGKKHSNSTKAYLSKLKKGMKATPQQLKNLLNHQIDRKNKTYEDLYGVEKAKKLKEKLSDIHKRRNRGKQSEETKQKIRKTTLKCWQDEEYRKKHTICWNDEVYRLKNAKARMKGLKRRPTSLEKSMIELIEKNNLPYKYVGDGSFFIGYKNPDFIHNQGKNILIEVANTIHHKEDYPQTRSDYFKKYGWRSIILMGNNLDEEKALNELSK